jgi:hypothetical protein
VDIGRAVQYWLNDPDWIKKVLIGGVLFFVPIIGWLIVGGFYIRTIQKVSSGADTPLPEWGDWGNDLVRGLKLAAVMIIWMLPIWILSVCVLLITFAEAPGGEIVNLLFNCLIIIYSIAFYFVFPVLVGRFAATEDITEALKVNEIIQDVQKIPSQLLIFVVMYLAVGFVASFGIILCIVGVAFTGFIAYLISGHLVAQISNMLGHTQPRQQQEQMQPPPPAF